MLKSNGGMNVLCVCFACAGNDEIVISGGADKSIRLFSRSGGELSYIFASAPVLSLDSHLSMVAFSCMDGSHGIFDTSDTKHVVTLQETHSKYVVCVRWSCSGAFLATASYDKTVNVYAVRCAILYSTYLYYYALRARLCRLFAHPFSRHKQSFLSPVIGMKNYYVSRVLHTYTYTHTANAYMW